MEKNVAVKELLSELIIKMGFEYNKLNIEESDNKVLTVNIEAEDAALLIGTQGKNLEAIQHLLKSLLYKKLPDEEVFLIVDIEDFKKRRQNQVLEIAREKADAVRNTKITQIMPPLNSYLRRLVHLEFTKDEYVDLTTDSVGEGESRRVRIIWKGTAQSDIDESETAEFAI
jgi:spoIIIJ-associated protein